MPIRFACPYCQARISAPGIAEGKKGKCPNCTLEVTVPTFRLPDLYEPSVPTSSNVIPAPNTVSQEGIRPRTAKKKKSTPTLASLIRQAGMFASKAVVVCCSALVLLIILCGMVIGPSNPGGHAGALNPVTPNANAPVIGQSPSGSKPQPTIFDLLGNKENDVQTRPADEVAVVQDSSMPGVLAAEDDDGWATLLRTANRKDELGLKSLIATGRAFVLQNGTRVRVTNTRFLTDEVVVLEGPHSGRKAIVAAEFLKR